MALTLLILATDLDSSGGIQRATRSIIAAAADAFGDDSVLILPVWGGKAEHIRGRLLRHNRGALTGRQHVSLAHRLRYAMTVLRAAVALRARKPTIIAMHVALAPLATLAAKITGGPMGVWCYGSEVWEALPSLTAASLRRADRVFAITEFTSRQLCFFNPVDPQKVEVLPLCVDPVSSHIPQESELLARLHQSVALTVARLDRADRYKGVERAIRAWPIVVASVPGAVLHVVGDGDDREHLQKVAADVGAEGAVRFWGRVSDSTLRSLYAQASVFLMPAGASTGPGAEGEGFGLVFIEANAAGVPVVAGRSGGIPEAVADGRSGFLVDPDDVNQIAAAVIRVIQDEELAQRMRLSAREWVLERFTYDRFVRDIDRSFQELAQSR